MRLQKQDGFTLVEAMIMVMILGILAGIAIPRFVGLGRRSTYMVARQLVSDLRYTRSLAVTSGNTYYLKFFPANSSEYTSYAIFDSSGEQKGDTRQIPSGIVCTSSEEEIYFYGLGNASVSGQVITLDDGNSQHYVYIISATGMVYEG